MYLRIIDTTGIDKQEFSARILFESAGRVRSFTVDNLTSSSMEVLQKDLDWYFTRHLGQEATDARRVIDRLLSYGRKLGDKLIGDDLQLMCYKEEIEDSQYSSLQVSIESSRISFFEEFWESLVLPESSYVLSSAAGAFIRKIVETRSTDLETDEIFPEPCRLELGGDSPLRVHYLRDSSASRMSLKGTNAYETGIDFLRYDEAVEFRMGSVRKPGDTISSTHIVHLEAELCYEGQALYFVQPDCDGASNVKKLSLSELCKSLKNAGCELLIFNIGSAHPELPESLPHGLQLSLAAQTALRAGISNVVGFSSPVDSWTASSCLDPLYRGLCAGLSVAQAVVEARKALQSELNRIPVGVGQGPFHRWPLLVHFEDHPVVFFDSPQTATDLLNTGLYARIRKGMYGFHAERLPPFMTVCSDSVVLECLMACRDDGGALIHAHGAEGMGKTQLLHMLAFCAVRDLFKAAFYFDYRDRYYTADDVAQMVDPVVSISSEGDGAAQEGDRFLFVFDNLDESTDSGHADSTKQNHELQQYVAQLIHQGHAVAYSSTGRDPLAGTVIQVSPVTIPIPPLGTLELARLSQLLLAGEDFQMETVQETLSDLLRLSKGNPFLAERLLQAFRAKQDPLLPAVLEPVLTGSDQDPVSSLREWEWTDLSPELRRWLVLLGESRGLVLEMLAVALDAKQPHPAASQLNAAIGTPASGFSSEVSKLVRTGWAVAFPAGSTLTTDSLAFIANQPDTDSVLIEHGKDIRVLFSRVICQALAAVIPQVLKNRDEMIIQNLLSNRWLWAKHLTMVWSEGFQSEFSQAVYPLVELLRQSGLFEEVSAWALSVLRNRPPQCSGEQEASDGITTDEVKLAMLALSSNQSEDDSVMTSFATECDAWLKRSKEADEDLDPALFSSIAQFLQAFYSKAGDYPTLEQVCRIAYRTYIDNEVWPLAVPSLERLIDCCYRNNKPAEGKELENYLVTQIPSGVFPDGFYWHLQARTVANRIARRELDEAAELLQSLLEQHELSESDQRNDMLALLEADLSFERGNLELAASKYSKLLGSEFIRADKSRLAMLEARYAELQTRLQDEAP